MNKTTIEQLWSAACSGDIDKQNDDTKIASTKIKIGAKINIAGIVKAAIEYTAQRIKQKAKSNEDYGTSSATGFKGASLSGSPESIAIAWGYKCKAKGVIGSYLVFADWDGDENKYWDKNAWKLKDAKNGACRWRNH